MPDEIEELGARIDGLRLCLAVMFRSLPDRDEALRRLMKAEHLARQRNLPSASIEIADLCATLSD